MLKRKNILSLFLLWLSFSGLFAQCPTFQSGNPGNPNRTVVFYGPNGEVVATCQCQLAGNNLKCGNSKPADNEYYYYEITLQSQTVICYSNMVLGVELKDYSAKKTAYGIECEWTTVLEENNDHFYWQKSPNGEQTWNLETLKGAGNNIGLLNYRFVDEDPIREWAYYRLVQVDQDGKETMYPWIYVYKDELRNTELRLFPNPTKDKFSFSLPYDWDTAELRIINLAGQVIYQQEVYSDDMEIEPQLTAGRYTVQIKTSIGCSYGNLLILDN